MKGLDVVTELNRLLQEELNKYWEEAPIGYNKDNDAYHMGKGIMVTKKGWDEYQEALKSKPDLKPLDYLVEEIKKLANEL